MLSEAFDQAAALMAASCPRCRAVGLVSIDHDKYAVTSSSDKHQAACFIDPSFPAVCSACGLVMEWPVSLEA